MAIHFFKDAGLTSRISEGNFSNPDDDTFNGTTGESRDREIFIANEQTSLDASLSAGGSTLTLKTPAFDDGETVAIGTERMTIISGGGTKTLQVDRLDGGSAYSSGTKVYSGYTYSQIKIDVLDINGTDESGWLRLAMNQADLDTATPGASLTVGTKNHDQTRSFWRRVTVPSGTQVQIKRDLQLKVTATVSPLHAGAVYLFSISLDNESPYCCKVL